MFEHNWVLKEMTIKNRTPIPLISDMLRSLSKGKIFSALDLKAAYNQLRIKDEDVYKTGFVTPFGHFESLVMLFGLTNAPAEFQTMMNELFRELIGVSVLVYLDDIVVYSENPADHPDHVRSVLQILKDNNLFCNLAKCQFIMSFVTYLGYILSSDGLSMDPEKLASIASWPIPLPRRKPEVFLDLRTSIASSSLVIPLSVFPSIGY
jgi:hypothetical protein